MPATLRMRLVQRDSSQKIIGDARAAVDAEQGVDDRPPEIEIGQQRGVAGQVRFRQRQIRGGKRLAFGRRGAGDHHASESAGGSSCG